MRVFRSLLTHTKHIFVALPVCRAIEELGGLELETDYPYKAKGEQCTFDKTKSRVRVTGAVDLPQNETAMAQYLVVNGPLSIGRMVIVNNFNESYGELKKRRK